MIDFTQFSKQSFSMNFHRIYIFKMIFIKSSSFHILFMMKIYFMVALIFNPVVEVMTSYDIFTAKRIYKSKHNFQTWGFLWKFSILEWFSIYKYYISNIPYLWGSVPHTSGHIHSNKIKVSARPLRQICCMLDYKHVLWLFEFKNR